MMNKKIPNATTADTTDAERRLMEDLATLGQCSVFSSWEWQMLRRLRDNGYVRKTADGAYELTKAGATVLSTGSAR